MSCVPTSVTTAASVVFILLGQLFCSLVLLKVKDNSLVERVLQKLGKNQKNIRRKHNVTSQREGIKIHHF